MQYNTSDFLTPTRISASSPPQAGAMGDAVEHITLSHTLHTHSAGAMGEQQQGHAPCRHRQTPTLPMTTWCCRSSAMTPHGLPSVMGEAMGEAQRRVCTGL